MLRRCWLVMVVGSKTDGCFLWLGRSNLLGLQTAGADGGGDGLQG